MIPIQQIARAAGAAALAGCCMASHAALSFSWTLQDWNPVVGPTDTVVLRATLFNDPGSGETLRGDRLLARVAEDIEDAYVQTETLQALATQLQDMVLAPGEQRDFEFGRYTPLFGTVAEGRYTTGTLALDFADASGRAVTWGLDRTLSIWVRRPHEPQALPEPGTAWLVGLPLLAWCCRARAGAVRRTP